MKKWLLILVALLAASLAVIYLFIPGNIMISESRSVSANQQAVLRYLSNSSNWKKIVPGNRPDSGGKMVSFTYEGYRFFLKKVLYNSVELTIEKNKNTVETILYFLPAQLDSFVLQWTTIISSGRSPYTKVQRYFFSRKLKTTLQKLLEQMTASFNATETIYGLDIKKEKVKFAHFLSAKRSITHYPGTGEIYEMITETRNYVLANGGKEVDYPILNVSTRDSIHFDIQVAIPVDKELPGNEQFASKWMMKDGNILAADIKGGIPAINKGFEQLHQYIMDYHRTVIAIPFQMLITDRTKEPDPAKWITRLYYPVV